VGIGSTFEGDIEVVAMNYLGHYREYTPLSCMDSVLVHATQFMTLPWRYTVVPGHVGSQSMGPGTGVGVILPWFIARC